MRAHVRGYRRCARADLGFAPASALEQGLAAEYKWLADNHCDGDPHRARACVCSPRCVAIAVLRPAACASARGGVPRGHGEPDKFLFDKGTDALNSKKWLTAREFFKQVTETYTAEPVSPGREARHRRHLSR